MLNANLLLGRPGTVVEKDNRIFKMCFGKQNETETL